MTWTYSTEPRLDNVKRKVFKADDKIRAAYSNIVYNIYIYWFSIDVYSIDSTARNSLMCR